jgi:hypothetical protein
MSLTKEYLLINQDKFISTSFIFSTQTLNKSPLNHTQIRRASNHSTYILYYFEHENYILRSTIYLLNVRGHEKDTKPINAQEIWQ